MMKRIFSQRFYGLLIALWMLALPSAKASHSMGSDLTYHCLGGNQYEITLSFYRDCAGIDADNDGEYWFFSRHVMVPIQCRFI
ncbi:MAG: hypothetical protein IPP51_10690 [Bacteroidetes bacterium]|nr:hypothetical protein [Bacteroidota bacterium]